MRILVDINHPHHVHLFRNAIAELKRRGHEILVTARAKDITTNLLSKYGLSYQLTARQRPGLLTMPFAVLELDRKLFRIARSFDPDLMIGTSFAIAHVSKLVRGKSIVFAEDNVNSSRLFWTITQPFADYIVTPDSLGDDFGKKHIKYPGYQELAYLHPNYFQPDPEVLTNLGIRKDEPFSIMRLVSFKASHDIGQRGINEAFRDQVLERLMQDGRVFISTEEQLPSRYHQFELNISVDRIHHLMAFAQLLVSDSQTMTIESAVLGVPSVRCNTFVGRTPVVEELEHKYGLTFGFSPDQVNEILRKISQILEMRTSEKFWKERRDMMLREKIDVTDWIVTFLEDLKR